ncbi:MAG: hypothetical protein ACKVOK_16840 [Flavobacteriales bacterium]
MKTLNQMPDNARIWIYTSIERLNASQITDIQSKTVEFLDDWTSHDQKMHAAFEIRNDHFLVLAVDESMAQASGCGIDKSVHHFQHLGATMNIPFFNRTEVFYMSDNQVLSVPVHQFWAMRKAGIIQDETLLFDTTVRTLGELNSKWLIPFSQSWHQEMWSR